MYIFSQYSHITCTLSQVQLKTDSDTLTAENTEDVMSSQLHVQLKFPRAYIYSSYGVNESATENLHSILMQFTVNTVLHYSVFFSEMVCFII